MNGDRYIEKVLNSWGKPINVQSETWHWDELVETDRDGLYIVDRFPLQVQSNEKYAQLDLYYDGVLRGEITRDEYLREELKLKRIFCKIWAFNTVELETNLREVDDSILTTVITKEQMQTVAALRAKLATGMREIDDVAEMEILIELGARERVHSTFVFQQFRMIAMTNDLAMPLFFADAEYKAITRTIVETEGLYLRKRKS